MIMTIWRIGYRGWRRTRPPSPKRFQAISVRIGAAPEPGTKPLKGLGAAELYQLCTGAVQEARATAKALAELRDKRKADAERLKELQDASAVDQRLAETMLDHFGVEDLEAVAGKLRQLDRRDELMERISKLEREIVDATRSDDLQEAEEVLSSCDRAELEREQAEIEPRFENVDRDVREHYAALTDAAGRVEAIGGDDAVARLEQERRVVLLEIEDRARQYMRLRAGTIAAETALRTYRERHRSSMMERASKAFASISRGDYTGLSTRPDGDSEILIAQAADGGSKLATEMSRGTRFQLYLALRMAGYLEFARSRRPVPFIADDIMESFDNPRSAETFRLLEEMARAGQVIYLTHHRHLCEMAAEICPGREDP